MPILAVDQFGQLYETSPDRADGKGYKGHATPVAQADVTLGNAYLKAQKQYNAQVAKEKQIQAHLDRQDAIKMARLNQEKVRLRDQRAMSQGLSQNQDYQQAQLRKAVQSGKMGASHDSSYILSGNGMTANGRSGWHGMTRDQKVIHHHMSGLGAKPTVAHQVDPHELNQARLKQQTAQVFGQLSKLQAVQQKADADLARRERIAKRQESRLLDRAITSNVVGARYPKATY